MNKQTQLLFSFVITGALFFISLSTTNAAPSVRTINTDNQHETFVTKTNKTTGRAASLRTTKKNVQPSANTNSDPTNSRMSISKFLSTHGSGGKVQTSNTIQNNLNNTNTTVTQLTDRVQGTETTIENIENNVENIENSVDDIKTTLDDVKMEIENNMLKEISTSGNGDYISNIEQDGNTIQVTKSELTAPIKRDGKTLDSAPMWIEFE